MLTAEAANIADGKNLWNIKIPEPKKTDLLHRRGSKRDDTPYDKGVLYWRNNFEPFDEIAKRYGITKQEASRIYWKMRKRESRLK